MIATGSAAHVPEVYADALPWDSRDATGVVDVPDRLVVVGGGVVACEAATWMAALGSAVTLVVRGHQLLSRTEPFAGEAVLAGLRERGVTVLLGTSVEDVRRSDPEATGTGRIHGGPVTLTTTHGELEADEVLLAIGRSPRLDDLGLSSVGPDGRRRHRRPAARVAVRRRRRHRRPAAHPLGQAPGPGGRGPDRGRAPRARSRGSPTARRRCPRSSSPSPRSPASG